VFISQVSYHSISTAWPVWCQTYIW